MLGRKHIIKFTSRVLMHMVFWVGVLLFYLYFFGVGSENFNYVLSFSLFLMPITIITTYVSIYILIPNYLVKKRYALFVLYSIYTLIISSYLIVLSIFYGLIYLSHFETGNMAPISKNMIFIMIAVYLVTIVVSAFKLLTINLKHTEKTSKLETKVLETQLKLKEQELQYLKMQIHPHFLFNTLNTLYGFALKKADETPEMIVKLSNLLDYLLYQIDKPFVSVEEEVNHIKDYIDLEQMRFNDSLNITFQTFGNCTHFKIAPMLLLPFVENSFKHSSLKNNVLTINIQLTCYDNSLEFKIENTILQEDSEDKGIGLTNIKKRLNLLYKDNYKLDIHTQNDLFKVTLKLFNT